jgi:hypothetical protein
MSAALDLLKHVMELNIIQDNEIFRVEQNRGGKLAEKL